MTAASLKQRPEVSAFDAETGTAFHAGAVEAFANARCSNIPFKHWLFKDAFPQALAHEIITLPIKPAEYDTCGKRDSHNEVRKFFTPEMQDQRFVVGAVADIFQSTSVVRALEKLCDIKLGGSYLRIEYCQDKNGFWLEPHMDIKEKLITMQIYLNTGSDAATLGTDMYDNEKQFHSRAPSAIGNGMIFIPKEPNSWHGFEKRPIKDVRRSLIINYVTDDWRARNELAFPEQPIAF